MCTAEESFANAATSMFCLTILPDKDDPAVNKAYSNLTQRPFQTMFPRLRVRSRNFGVFGPEAGPNRLAS